VAGRGAKECYDIAGAGLKSSLLYETTSSINSQRTFFSYRIYNSQDVQYSRECSDCDHIFACVGLRSKKYCIFNKQYSKDEYNELVPKIIKHAKEVPYSSSRGQEYRYGEYPPVELIEEMKKISVNNIPIKLVIICGKNISLTKQLQEKYSEDSQISVFGFYEPLQELMAAADVLVSKPGGLTMIESLYWGVPMIVTHFLPGQEELNIEYLTKRGLVTLCLEKNSNSLTEIIHKELISGELRAGLQSNKFREELVSKSLGKSVVDAMNNIA
jgi:hypothetical protein